MQAALSVLNRGNAPDGAKEQTPAATIRLGVIRALADGYPCIHWPGCPQGAPIQARTQVRVGTEDIGRECSFTLIENDPAQPLVLGLLYCPGRDAGPGMHATGADAPLVLQSEDAVILQSGPTRIELHADGRILIRGLQIDAQAYGPHRIKGAAVKIN